MKPKSQIQSICLSLLFRAEPGQTHLASCIGSTLVLPLLRLPVSAAAIVLLSLSGWMASADTVFDPVRTFEAIGDWQSVAVSRGGRQVLGAFEGGPVTLWDVQTGDVLRTFEGGTAPVAFSPDERWVFTGGANHAAILWDAQSGSLVRTFDGHTDTLTGVVFPADGRRVLTGSREGTARLWDAQTGQGIHTLTHTNPVVSVAFSPDGRQVLTGEEDGPPRLWQADTGQLQRVMAGLVGPVAFGYDSEVVVVGVPLIFYQSLRAQDAGRAKVKDGVKDGSRVAVAAAPRTSSPAAGRLARWGRWARDSDGLGAAIGGRSRSGNVPSRRCPGDGGAREDALISCGCRGICRGMKDRLAVTEDKIWDRVIRPEIGDLHRAAARELLRLHLAAEDARRVEELSNKANAGTLRADEEQELDHYLNVGRALEFLKAKARVSLRETSAPA